MNRIGTPRPRVSKSEAPATAIVSKTSSSRPLASNPRLKPPEAPFAPIVKPPDSPASLVPQGGLLAGRGRLFDVATRLSSSTDPVLAKAAEAASSVAGTLSLPRPVRLDLAEGNGKAQTLEGVIRRELKGPKGQEAVRVLFTPSDRSVRPFVIPTEAATGMAAFGRAELRPSRTADGVSSFELVPKPDALATHFIADVVMEDGKVFAIGRGKLAPFERLPLKGGEALVGAAVIARIDDGPSGPKATVESELGDASGPKARFLQLAVEAGAEVGFPPAAVAEAKAIVRNPKITGPDLTHLPFITIDNDDSMDLDQAMCLEPRPGGGATLHYAIADVAWLVPLGSALDKVAQRRASTAYPPGVSLPIFPREISEGVASLLPDGPRRAFVVTVDLDAKGRVEGEPKFQRGVIQSRAKLSYNGVQRLFDQGAKETEANAEYLGGLKLLRNMGQQLISRAKERGVVPSPDLEARVSMKGDEISIHRRGRNEVEKWNEQISLLVNSLVGQKIQSAGVSSLHRVHGEPDPSRIIALDAQITALGIPRKPGESISDYAGRLNPMDPRTRAIQRLLTRINPAARYSQEPAGHAALKLSAYDHFTAPMRRYSDVIVHRVLAALVEGTPVPYQGRETAKLDKVISRTDFARMRDNAISDRTSQLAMNEVLSRYLGQRRSASIVEVSPQGFKVELSDPEIDVMIPTATLNRQGKTGNHTLGDSGVELSGATGTYRLGTSIEVLVRKSQDGKIEVVPSQFEGSS
ncbi:MAG: RNB domain-containing ribonuclease [Deltaproteobacteria bacterium]|nr:RNB domain-containing ribonuclease [Deltaproteobacteria bacterium]